MSRHIWKTQQNSLTLNVLPRTKYNTRFGKQDNHFPVMVNDQGIKQMIA